MKVSDQIKYLQERYKPDDHICSIIWSVEDVILRAKDEGVEISVKEAQDILKSMDEGHDAEIGINWDVISCWIHMKDRERNDPEAVKHG